MRALQYRTFGSDPELVDIDVPEPGPSEIRLRVTAAGICRSDLHLLAEAEVDYAYKPLPVTLGHEVAGVVDKVGNSVRGVALGESVLVYGSWGCGRCYQCAQGNENNCRTDDRPPGIYHDGGMAEYIVVDDARHLIPLGDLDPVENVVLTDAGVTSYRAVKSAADKLLPGAVAVIIGVGGLGHIAIQMVKAMSKAKVVALDIGPEQLALACQVGADHAHSSDATAVDLVREITNGEGALVVLDFVGSNATGELAAAMTAKAGRIVMVGYGGGATPVGTTSVAYDVTACASNWGSRTDLMEVVELAKTGVLDIHYEKFTLEESPQAYRRLREGSIRGRAVVVP
ncbi:NAD(P)-dependent alcohol dehydrogenase [Rhodococcus sp. NBC_00297]|uniref:NAD(P)-dependent alcohol dehydrogenase n=1 Tax=Rhodococcus sp. NBC_00297 TaxID=2976005 RepID=UPI002E2D6D78|nr:NAD(P)-dependent alcohol dehydrogenase [Rhodococcus sp. NBC_00297]